MNELLSRGYVFNQDGNEEDVAGVAGEENDDILGEIDEDNDKEEMYSPGEDESLAEEV